MKHYLLKLYKHKRALVVYMVEYNRWTRYSADASMLIVGEPTNYEI